MEKTTVKKITKPAVKELKEKKPEKYNESVGRRKTAIARVRLFAKGEEKFLINGKTLEQYFSDVNLRQIVEEALVKMECADRFSVSVRVKGGGLHAQAEAIRHGISRTLVAIDEDFRKKLKKVGFLTRDPRMRERKKFGLKRARRAPQWSKR
jgi:small subunit ribosomal protein S9